MARLPRASRSRGRQVRLGSMQLEGFDELQQQLAELPRAVETGVLKRAGTKALGPIVGTAQQLAPVKSGALRASIRILTGTIRDAGFRAAFAAAKRAGKSTRGIRSAKGAKGEVIVQVVAGGAGARHAFWIELGRLKAQAQPFLRPAFDQKHNEALASLKGFLGSEIDKAVKRRAKGAARIAGDAG